MCGGICCFMFSKEVLVELLGGSKTRAILAFDVEEISEAINVVH